MVIPLPPWALHSNIQSLFLWRNYFWCSAWISPSVAWDCVLILSLVAWDKTPTFRVTPSFQVVGESDKISPEPPCPQDKTNGVPSTTPHRTCGPNPAPSLFPSPDTFQHLNVLLELKCPDIGEGLKVRLCAFPAPLFLCEDARNPFYQSDCLAGRDPAWSTAHPGAKTHPAEKTMAQRIPTLRHHQPQAQGSAGSRLTSAKPCGSRPPPISQRSMESGPGAASGPSCGTGRAVAEGQAAQSSSARTPACRRAGPGAAGAVDGRAGAPWGWCWC